MEISDILNFKNIIIFTTVILLFYIFTKTFRSDGLSQKLREARTTRDIKPVLAEIDAMKDADIQSIFNSAIKTLWDSYDRELAADLIKAFLERKDNVPIAQHWLNQLLTVEPEIARQKIDEDFLRAHLHEECAAKCGSCSGSCKSCKS